MMTFTKEVTEKLIKGLDEVGARFMSGDTIGDYLDVLENQGKIVRGFVWREGELHIAHSTIEGYLEETYGDTGLSAEDFLEVVKKDIENNGGKEEVYKGDSPLVSYVNMLLELLGGEE